MIPYINLLPWRLNVERSKLQRFITLLLFLILIMIVLFITTHFMMQRQLSRLLLDNQLIQIQLKKLDPTINRINQKLTERQQWIDKVNLLATLQEQHMFSLFLMKTIAKSMPNKAFINTLRYENKRITITGYAKDNRTITWIVSQLKTYPAFSQIALTEVIMNSDALYTHHFNITWLVTLNSSYSTPEKIRER